MLQLLAQNSVLRILLLLGLFGLVAIVSFIVAKAFATRQLSRRRLVGGGPDIAVEQLHGSLRADNVESAWLRLVNSIEKKGLSLVDTRDETLRRRLIAAGYRRLMPLALYTLIRLTLVLGLPILVLLFYWLTGSSPSLMKLYFSLVIAAGLGLYLPKLFVRARATVARRARQRLSGCTRPPPGMHRGGAWHGGSVRSRRHGNHGSHPLLAEQFGAVVLELRAGRSHDDALRRMADRAGVDDIRAFTTLLIQSTKLGSSIAQTLRTYSSEMREKRRMRAEEKAHRLPVLISIPLVACMLPCMIGVLMLPAAIRVVRAVLPALHGTH